MPGVTVFYPKGILNPGEDATGEMRLSMQKSNLFVAVIMILSITLVLTCGKDESASPGGHNGDTYDINANGIPKFVATDYIELDKIGSITKFRSSVGHDYSDDFESCRSMKHYFQPKGDVDWASISITSPVGGTVSRIFEEWAGTQVQIKSADYPAFYFIIFHISLSDSLAVGESISAGQLLGHHIGSQTMSDIAVGVNTPNGWKLVSYFDVMTDSLFSAFQARGVTAKDDLIISKEARDADTLHCDGELFQNQGNLENWVTLN